MIRDTGLPAKDDPQTYAIIGACMEVHSLLSCGFLESVYREALMAEFDMRGIPFRSEVPLPVMYKGRELKTAYRADFVVYGEVLLELKALRHLSAVEEAQLINYLKATGLRRGLLVNFGALKLEFKRMVN